MITYRCPIHGPILEVIPIRVVSRSQAKPTMYQLFQCGICGRWVSWSKEKVFEGQKQMRAAGVEVERTKCNLAN